jgi:molybdopterin-guanine dinucleotide biosynthesis protein A
LALSGRDGSTAEAPVGVVLAGGASRRMGRDKALLVIGGESLAQSAARRLAAVCPEVVLADAGRALLPGFRSVPDGPGRGPAGGILGAAVACPGRPLLVLACDLPHVPVPLLAEIARGTRADWVVPRRESGLEPLCAFYGPRALAVLAARVERGLFALHELAAENLAIRWLDEAELAAFGQPEEIFLNVNRPEDLTL